MAVGAGDPAIVKRLLDAGADATMPSVALLRLTPIQRAVIISREETIGQRMELMEEPNGAGGIAHARQVRRFPALPAEEKRARMQMLELLIGNKPAVRMVSPNGISPLHIAAEAGDAEVVKLLLDSGANVNDKCPLWMTPLHYAAFGNADQEVFDMLVNKGTDVNAPNKRGRTPLMLPAKMGAPADGVTHR